MLKILVVEDDAEKLRRVVTFVKSLAKCGADGVHSARDAADSKRLLRENQYDLLILDIALPERPENDPSPSGGIALMDEILARDIYNRPAHIVGLTAFPEMLESAGARFAELSWAIIFYESTSNDWLDKLGRKIHYIDLVKSGSVLPLDYGTSLCIVTALAEPELAAVLRLPWDWKTLERSADCTVYHRGQYKCGEEVHEVIAAAAPRMGMTAASALAMKMAMAFRPRYLSMVGVLAGVEGKCNIGDVVAADPAWDYESGKHHVKDGRSVFSPFPHQLGLDSFVRAQLFRLSQDQAALQEIRNAWPGTLPDTVLKLHIGPVACGAAVLADNTIVAELLESRNRKVVGIDMETYGVMCAADESPLPPLKAFCLKAVCDFANLNKDDGAQSYAAYTSAALLRVFAERYLK